jgi:hypothetical protein
MKRFWQAYLTHLLPVLKRSGLFPEGHLENLDMIILPVTVPIALYEVLFG